MMIAAHADDKSFIRAPRKAQMGLVSAPAQHEIAHCKPTIFVLTAL
jgi:hypothetical protein